MHADFLTLRFLCVWHLWCWCFDSYLSYGPRVKERYWSKWNREEKESITMEKDQVYLSGDKGTYRSLTEAYVVKLHPFTINEFNVLSLIVHIFTYIWGPIRQRHQVVFCLFLLHHCAIVSHIVIIIIFVSSSLSLALAENQTKENLLEEGKNTSRVTCCCIM